MDDKFAESLNTDRIVNGIKEYIRSGETYIDSIIEYSNREGIEIELIGDIIKKSPTLKSKILEEAEDMNMVKKLERLPI